MNRNRHDIKTCETFDIVLKSKHRDDGNDIHRPPGGIHPGCQDVPLSEVEFLKNTIFDKIACDHGYIVEVVRKVHAWCRNCGVYIGYAKLPFEVKRFRYAAGINPETEIKMESRCFRCQGCYFHTIVPIRDLMVM